MLLRHQMRGRRRCRRLSAHNGRFLICSANQYPICVDRMRAEEEMSREWRGERKLKGLAAELVRNQKTGSTGIGFDDRVQGKYGGLTLRAERSQRIKEPMTTKVQSRPLDLANRQPQVASRKSKGVLDARRPNRTRAVCWWGAVHECLKSARRCHWSRASC